MTGREAYYWNTAIALQRLLNCKVSWLNCIYDVCSGAVLTAIHVLGNLKKKKKENLHKKTQTNKQKPKSEIQS